MKEKKESREEAIKRCMKYSKRDLVIMYLNTREAFDGIVKLIKKKRAI